jgi:hypothetical protein
LETDEGVTMVYKPNYDNNAIRKESTKVNISGQSPQTCVAIEEHAQRLVAEDPTWLMAKKIVNLRGRCAYVDSKVELEGVGFTELASRDGLFYSATPPEGWTKETEGYWTTIYDNNRVKRMSQFFKGAFYDMHAELSILEIKDENVAAITDGNALVSI